MKTNQTPYVLTPTQMDRVWGAILAAERVAHIIGRIESESAHEDLQRGGLFDVSAISSLGLSIERTLESVSEVFHEVEEARSDSRTLPVVAA